MSPRMASSRIFLVDDLAWWLGRVSLNPAKHIDHFGTIILPSALLLLRATFLFGSTGKRIFANTLKYSLASMTGRFCDVRFTPRKRTSSVYEYTP
jgi:Zn-dependent protease